MGSGQLTSLKIRPEFRPPRGWRRALARMPIWLYRARLGWLVGKRFLLLTHTGRSSGRPRLVVLEVMRFDPQSGTCYVASGFGERAQWFRNIRQNPSVTVEIGRLRFPALAEPLSMEEAAHEFADYARRRPVAARTIARLLRYPIEATDPEFAHLAQWIPVVALRRHG